MCATAAKLHEPVVLHDMPEATYGRLMRALGQHRLEHAYRDDVLEVFSPLLHGIDWRTYERILAAFGDRRFPHTYDNGNLEIMMSPSREHERIKRLLGRIVEMASIEFGMWICSTSSETQRNELLAKGLEPDESYYLRPRKRGQKLPLDPKGAPDLAIEIDLRRTELKRFRSYAALGVRELWRYRRNKVEILRPSMNEGSELIERSEVFPLLTANDLTRFVKRLQKRDENLTVLEFVSWLRKKIEKSRQSPRKRET